MRRRWTSLGLELVDGTRVLSPGIDGRLRLFKFSARMPCVFREEEGWDEVHVRCDEGSNVVPSVVCNVRKQQLA